MKFEFSDSLPMVKPHKTKDGFLVGDVRAARTGIQIYAGAEVGHPEKTTVRVYRPEDEVFSVDSMRSFANRVVTNDHPPVMVDATNWKEHTIGHVGTEVARDGEYIRVPMSLMDGLTIELVEQGKRELSAGYTCDLDFTPGVTPSGESYDAVQRNIRVNHIAVVDTGRAGPRCRLGDSIMEKNEMTLKTIVFDGITVETTPQGAEVITKLQDQLGATQTALKDASDNFKTQIAAKDTELGKKDAEIQQLKDAANVDLDKLVAERADVITKAKKFGDVDTAGKTNAEIRQAAVALRFGDEKIKDRSEDYIMALFDSAIPSTGDPVRDALIDAKPVNKGGDAAATAYDAHIDELGNAWKGDK